MSEATEWRRSERKNGMWISIIKVLLPPTSSFVFCSSNFDLGRIFRCAQEKKKHVSCRVFFFFWDRELTDRQKSGPSRAQSGRGGLQPQTQCWITRGMWMEYCYVMEIIHFPPRCEPANDTRKAVALGRAAREDKLGVTFGPQSERNGCESRGKRMLVPVWVVLAWLGTGKYLSFLAFRLKFEPITNNTEIDANLLNNDCLTIFSHTVSCTVVLVFSGHP